MLNKNKTPVYISLTSIFDNQNILLQTLQSIIIQKTFINNIFLYLSEDSYILDKGFKNKQITNLNLLHFLENNKDIIHIKWVENIGSYRKLLPLLKEKWNEDCFIITIDDDTFYNQNLIKNLLDDYEKYKCVINYRGFTPKFSSFNEFHYYRRDNLKKLNMYNFPTGKGSILYKPYFFHKTQNLIFDKNKYLKYCKVKDDVWFYFIRILNNINCFIDNKKYMKKDISSKGLYIHFNKKKNNSNTIAIRNTAKILNIKM